MEVATDEKSTPIKQDMKKGKLRDYPCFTKYNQKLCRSGVRRYCGGGMSLIDLWFVLYSYNINWNYGMLPQTWEDPKHKNDEVEGMFGDNDPVDI
eukprot:3221336-Pyramimonas_sp.AAC.1